MDQDKKETTRSHRFEKNAHRIPCSSKIRKVDAPIVNNRQELSRILNNESLRDGDLTQKLVTMWLGSATDPDNRLLSNIQENTSLRVCQQQCLEDENYIQKLQQKFEKAENHINVLSKYLRSEEKSKLDLTEKINATTDMVAIITQHINYITNTLGRCQQHKDHLFNLYHSIILRQRDQVCKLRKHEEMLRIDISKLGNEKSALIKYSTDSQIYYENKLREKEAELASVHTKQDHTQKELEAVVKEKEDLTIRLSKNENDCFDLKNECLKYKLEITDITNKLAEASANLDSLKNEKLNTNDELIAKNLAIEKMSNDLEFARAKHEEQLAVISSLKSANTELTKQLKHEENERENLTQSLNILDTINADLDGQVEKLKENTSEEIEELKRKLENAESEKSQILKNNEKVRKELETKHFNEVKAHREKYDSCLAKLKALEVRYERKISRLQKSSAPVTTNTNAEESQLEELDLLKREECEQNLHQVDNLFMKDVISEVQLKRKIKRHENEFASLSAMENKLGDERNLETTGKGKSRPVQTTSTFSTYKKSILKPSVSRKPGSSLASLSLPPTKKICFENIFSLSQESPVKLTGEAKIMDVINNDDAFDETAATQATFSQPLQYSQSASQNTHSQVQTQSSGKKFFKSRASQFK